MHAGGQAPRPLVPSPGTRVVAGRGRGRGHPVVAGGEPPEAGYTPVQNVDVGGREPRWDADAGASAHLVVESARRVLQPPPTVLSSVVEITGPPHLKNIVSHMSCFMDPKWPPQRSKKANIAILQLRRQLQAKTGANMEDPLADCVDKVAARAAPFMGCRPVSALCPDSASCAACEEQSYERIPGAARSDFAWSAHKSHAPRYGPQLTTTAGANHPPGSMAPATPCTIIKNL
eukprot:CAMPEP_0204477114 /NCGR_PEP_ID=MMETSP0471-20130131/30881_1 /ASSEMBLY_ACC=CAM_ASM_000602 /TAXON_ID=2969 /ORGANISM="Oxyrrhis marina" /LENGTH=231 /DNA_ID=CAMNT_0051479785 /DNA_START=110 /DNA_END=804 /DNA_ORIENTATION=-